MYYNKIVVFVVCLVDRQMVVSIAVVFFRILTMLIPKKEGLKIEK
jgi:hypothetical protein